MHLYYLSDFRVEIFIKKQRNVILSLFPYISHTFSIQNKPFHQSGKTSLLLSLTENGFQFRNQHQNLIQKHWGNQRIVILDPPYYMRGLIDELFNVIRY